MSEAVIKKESGASSIFDMPEAGVGVIGISVADSVVNKDVASDAVEGIVGGTCSTTGAEELGAMVSFWKHFRNIALQR